MIAGFEEAYGPAHPSTLATVYNLAILLREQGKYDEAEPLYRRALAGKEEALGPAHPDTLGTVEGLAILLKQQGKYDEAEPLYRRALAGNEEALGPVHPDTLRTVNNLALLLDAKGEDAAARGARARRMECSGVLGEEAEHVRLINCTRAMKRLRTC